MEYRLQSCTEMVMPMCPDGENDMFEKSPWDLKAFSKKCWAKWKVRPQAHLAEKIYGGRNIESHSNIIFRYVKMCTAAAARRSLTKTQYLLTFTKNIPSPSSFPFRLDGILPLDLHSPQYGLVYGLCRMDSILIYFTCTLSFKATV